MVNHFFNSYYLVAQLADNAEKIPPTTRSIAYMALLGIILLGLFLVVIILLGGHWVRRLGSYRRGPAVPSDLILGNEKTPSTDSQTDAEFPDNPSTNDTVRPDDTVIS